MAQERPPRAIQRGFVRVLLSRILLAANFALFAGLVYLFVYRSAMFSAGWDGPAVATVALTAAAIILAAVGVGVALLAIWGYTTLREHAENTAIRVADETVNAAVDKKIQEILQFWDPSSDRGSGDEVARAYERE
jgi:hypothetical protein